MWSWARAAEAAAAVRGAIPGALPARGAAAALPPSETRAAAGGPPARASPPRPDGQAREAWAGRALRARSRSWPAGARTGSTDREARGLRLRQGADRERTAAAKAGPRSSWGQAGSLRGGASGPEAAEFRP